MFLSSLHLSRKNIRKMIIESYLYLTYKIVSHAKTLIGISLFTEIGHLKNDIKCLAIIQLKSVNKLCTKDLGSVMS